MGAQPHPLISPEEYVALEQDLGFKHEYRAGQMFAMAGVSGPHSHLQVNVAMEIAGTSHDNYISRCINEVGDSRDLRIGNAAKAGFRRKLAVR